MSQKTPGPTCGQMRPNAEPYREPRTRPSKCRIRPLSLSLRPYSRRRCLLTFSGRGRNPCEIRALLRAVRVIVESRAAQWDLTAMDGMTVTFDLEATVTQIDRVRNHRSPSAYEPPRGG